MKDETGGVPIEEFVGLKCIHSFLFIVHNSERTKAKGVNRNIAATISHNEQKSVLWKNKRIRHSRSRIQSKNHRIETYEINKILLSYFDDKKYIQKNGYEGLVLG